MGHGHPVSLRERVVRAYEAGLTSEETATLFGVGSASVKRWTRLQREKGSLEPRPPSEGRPPRVSAEELSAALRKLPNATSGELAAELNRGRRGKDRVHVSSVKRALHRQGYVVKKSESGLPSSFVRK